MIDNIFYILIGLSAFCFCIGLTYRLWLEKEMKNKDMNSNKIERLESIQFAYYLIGIVLLVMAFGTTATLFY